MVKTILKIIQPIRRLYWWVVRPTTRGVRAIVINSVGQILLVRHKYQEGWFLPGGKANKNEKDEEALKRELWEEAGIDGILKLEKLGEYNNTFEYKKDTIAVFVVSSFTQKPKTHFELEEKKFFDSSLLPDKTSPGTRRRIEEWLGKITINNQW